MSQEPNTEAATEARRSKQSRWDHGDEFSRNGRSKSKFSQIYELFIHFCENTSLRGVPQIVRSSDPRNHLLWLNFISIFFIACMACLIIITNQYLQYDVIHQPKRIFDAPRAFPSLTICNLRPFKSSGVDRLIRQGAVPVQAYFDVIMKVASTLDKRYASQFTTLLSHESYLLNLPKGMDPSNLGHRLEQLVQTCVVLYQNGTLIRGTDCGKAGYWVKTLNRIYHNCYTYELDPQIRAKTLSVEMVLYLDNIVEHKSCFDCQDRIRGSQLTGARLLLNPDSSYPRIVEEGINLMPGTLTDIHCTVREWSMMTPLYGRCSHVALVEIWFGGQTYSYTEQACQQGVLQEMIARSCGCLSYDMPVPSHLEGNATTNASLPYCQFFELPVVNIGARSDTEVRCRYFTQQAMERFITRMYCSTAITRNMLAADTGCRAPCIRYSYDMQISTAQWPIKRFITNFANNQLHRKKQAAKRQSKSANFEGSYAKQEEEDESRFVELLRPYAAIHNMTTNGKEVEAVDLLMHMQDVEQNFLSIIVSRPNFDIIRVEEKAVVTLTSLFSQIGGLLSIWVGITMICIVEVAEFLLNCLDVLCGRIP